MATPIITPASSSEPPDSSSMDAHNQPTFTIDSEALRRVLHHPSIADKRVCVVSVAGAFRTGKSFMLNFFLRYLRWQTGERTTDSNVDDWMASADSIEGFCWRGGDDLVTSGILIWPEPFLLKDQDGGEIVVILMDTQGIFDAASTFKDCTMIFALATMISSVQVFNIRGMLQTDHLQHLQLFTEYARLALEEYDDDTPFQSLLFLVRDWSYPYDAAYGMVGGGKILEKRFNQPNAELRQLQQHIRSCFNQIQCFLMPHPGLEVATNPNFLGELDMIAPEFQTYLRDLVHFVFSPSSLTVKTVNKQPLTCRELSFYFEAYFGVFNGNILPEPKLLLNATTEANLLCAFVNCKTLYLREMEVVCRTDTPYLWSNQLRAEHERCKGRAIGAFTGARKLGGKELSEQIQKLLVEDIESTFGSFVQLNESKLTSHRWRTPSILFLLALVCYLLGHYSFSFGFGIITGLLNVLFALAVFALSVWSLSAFGVTHLTTFQWGVDTLVQSALLTWATVRRAQPAVNSERPEALQSIRR